MPFLVIYLLMMSTVLRSVACPVWAVGRGRRWPQAGLTCGVFGGFERSHRSCWWPAFQKLLKADRPGELLHSETSGAGRVAAARRRL